jgi:hypothetical protein
MLLDRLDIGDEPTHLLCEILAGDQRRLSSEVGHAGISVAVGVICRSASRTIASASGTSDTPSTVCQPNKVSRQLAAAAGVVDIRAELPQGAAHGRWGGYVE